MYNTGDLKSLGLLWTNLATTCYTEWVDKEDILSFSTRLDHEGLHFLTVTLPTIGKALDNYHSTNEWVSPPDFKSVRMSHSHLVNMTYTPTGGEASYRRKTVELVPVFLARAVIAALGGNPQAVDCVRQLTLMFYKLEVDYDSDTTKRFLDQFIEVDHSLVDSIDSEDIFTSELIDEMRRIVARVLCNEDPSDIRPCHGSGATACHTPNAEKYHKLRYYKKLDDVFPYSEYFFYSPTHLADELETLEASQESVPRARVCLVPKDSRGPRIISCEPAELLYIQQGLMRKLYRCLETSPITAGQVNFTDQSINQQLAKRASKDGSYATIDLSDASDRVSWNLVQKVFPEPWVRALGACRSESTLLPDGREVKLQKFAPMGSSCCFPVEALVFWACAEAASRIAISRIMYAGEEPTEDLYRRKYVYGDDIIVAAELYPLTVMALEKIGLKVNRSKSYASGPFRESCGGEYYLGVDVTPVRIRKAIGDRGRILQTNADLVNELITKFGYDKVRDSIDMIEVVQRYVFPRTGLDLPMSIKLDASNYRGVPLWASNDAFFRVRFNKDLQRYEHRVLTLSSANKQAHPPDWGELLRKELSKDVARYGKYLNPLAIMESKLEPGFYMVPHSIRTKWAWVWLG